MPVLAITSTTVLLVGTTVGIVLAVSNRPSTTTESNTQLNVTTTKSALQKAQEIYSGHIADWVETRESMIANGVPESTIETVKNATFIPFQNDYKKALAKNAK